MKASQMSTGKLKCVLQVLLRVVAVTITLYPALRKFTEYSFCVEQFATYGIPWPELLVPLTRVIELVAIFRSHWVSPVGLVRLHSSLG